jgi:uncharacterized peroxidase-related enzyme
VAFIKTTAPDEASGDARAMYARQQERYGYVPNYAKVFCDRPDVMNLWADLLSGIRRNVDSRRFELVTLAAALELGSSYCSLAHAKVLGEKFLSEEELRSIAAGDTSTLSETEVVTMALARKVVADSSSVTRKDVDALRENGLSEDEIFDVVAVAAARAFFAKLVDALGTQPDSVFLQMQSGLRELLTVGRPIAEDAPTRLE